MGSHSKILQKIIFGRSDSNIDFSELCNLLNFLGFNERVKGSHHIFTKSGIPEILNIQPKGSKGKSYQVKQIRNLIIKYQLGSEEDE
jgi:predicted RNA binding protein YcfA (HicA-like mRNA interferase family)